MLEPGSDDGYPQGIDGDSRALVRRLTIFEAIEMNGGIADYRYSIYCFFLILLLASCSKEGNSGRVIIMVNDEPVTAESFEAQLEYELSFQELRPGDAIDPKNPGLKTLDQLKTEILCKKLIPMAAVRSTYKTRMREMEKEMEAIHAKLEDDRSNFANLASEHSKDANAKQGGSWRVVTRRSLYYPVPRLLFNARADEVIGPVFSLVGCHLLWLQVKHKGVLTSDDTVEASHILLPYDESRLDFLPVVVDELVAKAKIEVKDPAYAPFVEDLFKK